MKNKSLNYVNMPPDLALWLILTGSNYPCLEQINMVPKMFELLRFDCTYNKKAKDSTEIWTQKIINKPTIGPITDIQISTNHYENTPIQI